jgi:hypothetical protein
MALSGRVDFFGARLGFILIAAFIPPLTAALACSFTSNRELALISGLLAAFSGYHAPFLSTTDNFGIYMILGGLFFLVMRRAGRGSAFALGAIAGLMQLARSDGLMWVAFAFIVMVLKNISTLKQISRANIFSAIPRLFFVLSGYLLTMGPWLARNLIVYGAPLAPGNQRALWLINYDDTFAFPPARLTLDYLIRSGWQAILDARLWALKQNLLNAFAAQGAIALIPFILIGAWLLRRDARVRLGVIGWGLLLTVMTIVFPFAGARGSFFHAGASFQMLWWSLAPVGLDRVIDAARNRNWFTPQAYRIFRAGLAGMMIALTATVIAIRILVPGWGGSRTLYLQVDQILRAHGAAPQDVTIVVNPPGYYNATGRAAIVLPVGGEGAYSDVAQKFGARYLVLEKDYLPKNFESIFANPNDRPDLELLADLGQTRVFYIQP